MKRRVPETVSRSVRLEEPPARPGRYPATDGLALQSGRCDATPVLRVKGTVDFRSASLVRRRIQTALAAHPRFLIIDLAGVSYLDSSGLAVLLAALREARASDTALAFCAPTQAVRAVVELSGLAGAFRFHARPEDAARELRSLGTAGPSPVDGQFARPSWFKMLLASLAFRARSPLH